MKKNKKKSTLIRILSYTKKHIFLLVIALLSAMISVFATLYTSVLIGEAIDDALNIGAAGFEKIPTILIIIFITVIIASIFQWIMSFLTNLVANKTVVDLRVSLFDKLQAVPLKLLDSNSHGDIMSRMTNDIDQISDGLLQGFTKFFLGSVTIIFTIGFMFSINWIIATIVIVLSPLSLFVARFIAKRVSKHFREQAAVKGELSGYIEEAISGQDVIMAFGFENKSGEIMSEVNDRLYKSGVKSQFFSSLTNPCTRFVNSVVYAVVGVTGAMMAVFNPAFSFGMISVFLGYANQYTKPFNEISGVMTELQSAVACGKRVFSFLDEQDEITDGSIELNNCNGNVDISNVSFSYSSDKTLIQNLNVKAQNGERIAIVGPTGCGKTTIINLLMRFYDVNNGSISVDGIDITKLTRDSLRRSYGMVLQDTWLFSGTIAENISYSKENATRDEVIAAAKSAHAHSFIKRLENGYDTAISQDGGNLSGGQRQLLCIARVMLSLPPMLILDEATSSIDTLTEHKIQRAFAQMMKGRTSFIVAHRLSTIQEADCILVMDKGKIIEQGTHDELLKKGGFYSELYQSQFKHS